MDKAPVLRTVSMHIHTHGQFSISNSSGLHVFGLWTETGVPGWNPHTFLHEERIWAGQYSNLELLSWISINPGATILPVPSGDIKEE